MLETDEECARELDVLLWNQYGYMLTSWHWASRRLSSVAEIQSFVAPGLLALIAPVSPVVRAAGRGHAACSSWRHLGRVDVVRRAWRLCNAHARSHFYHELTACIGVVVLCKATRLFLRVGLDRSALRIHANGPNLGRSLGIWSAVFTLMLEKFVVRVTFCSK